MDRSGYPVEVAIGLLVLLAFLYLSRHSQDVPGAVAATTVSSQSATTGR